ncbi:ensconsin-like isoform X2 [Synchiropus splendidus]|uniref:ensconsin-like isoform X2 n=1 Tax=Synchiropus splendidus TaxID=270530 RepID=UPI00237D8547|nr:ensconsin-like isoform X2 [Synchiropus splendidus]
MAVQKTAAAPAPGLLAWPSTDSPRKGPGRQSTRDQRLHGGRQVRSTASPLTASPRAHPGTNGTDERLRAARERREQQQRSIASREQERVEREQRARFYHQQQLQERQKKLLQQRQKEQQRRAAVEEKRRQKLRQERERHESAVRRTQEKSQKALAQGPSARGRTRTHDAARAAPLTPWEKNLVNRLATPTCSYLARSQSAGCQSGEEASYYSTTTSPQFTPPKPRRPPVSPSPSSGGQRGVSAAQVSPPLQTLLWFWFVFRDSFLLQTQAKKQDRRPPGAVVRTSPSSRPPAVSKNIRPSKNIHSRATSPSPDRTPRRNSPSPQPELPPVPEEGPAVCVPAGNSSGSQPGVAGQTWRSKQLQTEAGDAPPPAGGGQRLQEQQQQEEAGRLLAEKRRQARLLREQEERERLEREETERPRQEELQRQRAEAQRLVQEKRRREEEEQRRAQEERAQAMREAALLQKQRQEEEEEKAGEKARAERAALAQREDAERQVRRKRLEEIMRRTRRSDSPETKPAPARALPSDPPPKENTEPVQKVLLETVVKLGHDEDAVPLVAFKERRSVRTRTGLEELQRHQRAEVIS